jgi:hypothetical protein
MGMAVQGSLLPFDSPDNVLLHLERVARRVQKLAPDMSPPRCVRVLSELALFEQMLDAEEVLIRHSVRLQAQRLGLI